MTACLFVGLGGFLGAVARYLLSLAVTPVGAFPLATFLTNLAGAVLIGFLAGLSVRLPIDPRLMLFLKTGVCGGFTTFSTFSLETAGLLASKKAALGLVYAVLSVALCVVGVFLGQLAAGSVLRSR